MEFIVSRASDFGGSDRPCVGATQKTVKRDWVDIRYFNTPEEFDRAMEVLTAVRNEPRKPPWFSEGRNHRGGNGQIARDMDGTVTAWFVEIPDLPSLLSFAKEVNEEVIVNNDHGDFPSLKIYDGPVE